MVDREKLLVLADEVKNLIIEFYDVAKIVEGYEENDESPLTFIEIRDNGETIAVRDTFIEGEQIYELQDISEIFKIDMRGFGPCSAQLYESIGIAQSEVEDEYRKKDRSKDEFIRYVGSLYYAEYRCEEIYQRLEEIEEEVKSVLD